MKLAADTTSSISQKEAIHLHNLAETAALYERIGKAAVIEALVLYGHIRCGYCVADEDCDQKRDCEERIADVLWARAEAKAWAT